MLLIATFTMFGLFSLCVFTLVFDKPGGFLSDPRGVAARGTEP